MQAHYGVSLLHPCPSPPPPHDHLDPSLHLPERLDKLACIDCRWIARFTRCSARDSGPWTGTACRIHRHRAGRALQPTPSRSEHPCRGGPIPSGRAQVHGELSLPLRDSCVAFSRLDTHTCPLMNCDRWGGRRCSTLRTHALVVAAARLGDEALDSPDCPGCGPLGYIHRPAGELVGENSASEQVGLAKQMRLMEDRACRRLAFDGLAVGRWLFWLLTCMKCSRSCMRGACSAWCAAWASRSAKTFAVARTGSVASLWTKSA